MTLSICDPQFPQISEILESSFMLEVLQNSLFGNIEQGSPMLKIERCSVGEKRHKPGKSFLLSYHLGLQDIATGIRYEQLLSAQLCLPGQGLSEFEAYLGNGLDKRLDIHEHSPIRIPPVSYVPEVDMLLWAFPNDRKLPHLPKLLDTENLASYFAIHLSDLWLSPSEHITSVQTKLMHYLPECSCMIRYTLTIADESSGSETRQIILYGKNYPDDSGVEAYSIMRQLVEQTCHFAKPYSYDAETKTLWQSHVPGEPFEWTSALVENHRLIAKVAVCIAAFHGCTLDATGCYGFSDIDVQLKATCDLAAVADSTLGERVQAAVQVIQLNYKQLNWNNTLITPIHLDLKMGNLLISDEGVTLIDMDCVRLGDPLLDIGSFVANLYLNGLRFGSTVAEIDKVVAIFCNEYCAAVDWVVDHAKLTWYISAALIHEVVRRSLRQQNVERLKQVGAIIKLSNHFSALCRKDISGASYASK